MTDREQALEKAVGLAGPKPAPPVNSSVPAGPWIYKAALEKWEWRVGAIAELLLEWKAQGVERLAEEAALWLTNANTVEEFKSLSALTTLGRTLAAELRTQIRDEQ